MGNGEECESMGQRTKPPDRPMDLLEALCKASVTVSKRLEGSDGREITIRELLRHLEITWLLSGGMVRQSRSFKQREGGALVGAAARIAIEFRVPHQDAMERLREEMGG